MRSHQIAGMALALLATAGLAAPAAAQPEIPAPQYEAGPPPPPPGPPSRFVLEPGHWQWGPRAGRYYWVRRHWIETRPGYVHFIPGHWEGGAWIGAHWGG